MDTFDLSQRPNGDVTLGGPSRKVYAGIGSIPAADFAIRTSPPERRLVALLSAYFDDSQSSGDVWVVSGYVGYKNQWDFFERLWEAVMAKHGVPYFHRGY